MQTIIIYGGLIILNGLFGILNIFSNVKLKKILLVSIFILISLVVGLRAWIVGTDTISYIQSYITIGSIPINELSGVGSFAGNERLEIGFVYLIKLLNVVTNNPQILLLFEAIFLYYTIFININKYSLSPFFSVFLMITLGIFITSMNLLRQSIALGFCLLGYYFWCNNKYLSFWISILIGGLFIHRTAILFLLLFISKKIKFNNKAIYCTLIISIIFYYLYVPFFQLVYKIVPYYQNYQNSYNNFGSGKASAIFNIIFVLLVLFLGQWAKNNGSFNKIFTYDRWNEMSIMLLLSVLFTFLSLRFTQVDRINVYFRAFYIFYIPNCIQILKNKNQKIFFTFIYIFIALIYFLYILIVKDNWSNIVPYDFFWNIKF